MSIRWSRHPQPQQAATVVTAPVTTVEFKEGAMLLGPGGSNSTIMQIDAGVNLRLEEMSRRVEDVQRRNAELEAKISAGFASSSSSSSHPHQQQRKTDVMGRIQRLEQMDKAASGDGDNIPSSSSSTAVPVVDAWMKERIRLEQMSAEERRMMLPNRDRPRQKHQQPQPRMEEAEFE
jgi:hypothetical protein